MTLRMITQLWNTNTTAIVSCDADLRENYMYISMKFRTGVMYFAGKLVYLIVRASNQLAVKEDVLTYNMKLSYKYYKGEIASFTQNMLNIM